MAPFDSLEFVDVDMNFRTALWPMYKKILVALLVSLGCSGQLGRVGAHCLLSGYKQHQARKGEHDPASG